MNNDRLTEPEGLDGCGHGVDRLVVMPRITGVRLDVGELPKIDFHVAFLSATKLEEAEICCPLETKPPAQGV